jgi:hypothetical protein
MGASFGLESVTAVALGGVQLTGGVGSVLGVVTGALSLGLMTNGINLFGISPFLRGALTGVAAGGRVRPAQKGGGPVNTATMQPANAPVWRRLLRAALALPPAYAGLLVLLLLAAVTAPAIAVGHAAAADRPPGRAAGAGGDRPIAGDARTLHRPVVGRRDRGRLLPADQRLLRGLRCRGHGACAWPWAWWWGWSTAC